MPGAVELYHFHTPAESWRYTSGKRRVVFGGDTYTPRPITRQRWDQSLTGEDLKFEAPEDMLPLSLFGAGNPSHVVLLDIMDLAGNILFTGTLNSVEFDEEMGSATCSVAVVSMLLKGAVGREFSPSCNWRLGQAQGSLCGVNLANPLWTTTLTVAGSVITPRSIQNALLATFDDGWFAKGTATKGGEALYILSHVGDTIFTLSSFILPSIANIVVVAGCMHTQEICATKFDNLPNFGGFVKIPPKNPVVDRLGEAFNTNL